MSQSRKIFIGKAVIFLTSWGWLAEACRKETTISGAASASSADSTSGSAGSATCIPTPEETAGPYPYDLSADAALFRTDITEGKTGVPMELLLTLVNTGDGCSPVGNARVDIWPCDKDGYYSEYNVTGYLGTENNSGKTFLRGIQLTDAKGEVTFRTIYPGWYTGRATHIHIEVFVGSVLKKTTQLAFPADITAAVYNSPLYSTHGQNTTSNAQDQVFADSVNEELVTISGNTTAGYAASFIIGIAL